MRNRLVSLLVLAIAASGCVEKLTVWPPLVPPDGSERLAVMVPEEAGSYALSPDGIRVAYQPDGWSQRIHVATLGSIRETIFPIGRDFQGIRWSPRGDALFVTSQEDLLRVPLAGGPIVTVARVAGPEGFDISPDGTRLALWSDGGSPLRGEVSCLDLASGERRVLFEGGFSGPVRFSPSGRSVLVQPPGDGLRPIYLRVVPVDGGAVAAIPLRLRASGAWLPDGRILVMEPGAAGYPARFRFVALSGETERILVVPGMDGATLLAFNPRGVSPDGAWAVNLGDRGISGVYDLRDGRLVEAAAQGLQGWLGADRVVGRYPDGIRAMAFARAFPRADAPASPAPTPTPAPVGEIALTGDWAFALPGLPTDPLDCETYRRFRIADSGDGEPPAAEVAQVFGLDGSVSPLGKLSGRREGGGYVFEGEALDGGPAPVREALRLRLDGARGRLVGDRRVDDGEWLPVELAPALPVPCVLPWPRR